MKNQLLKLTLLAALVMAGTLATAPKAEARIFPGSQTGQCIGGYYDTVYFGWFGTVKSVESTACD